MNEDQVKEISGVLRTISQAFTNYRKYHVRPLGSVANGTFLKGGSDLDLTLVLPEGEDEERASRIIRKQLPEYTDDGRVNFHEMRRKIKVHEFRIQGYEAQIVINNYYGMMNTELIRFYCEFDSRFHKLAIFLKWWVAHK